MIHCFDKENIVYKAISMEIRLTNYLDAIQLSGYISSCKQGEMTFSPSREASHYLRRLGGNSEHMDMRKPRITYCHPVGQNGFQYLYIVHSRGDATVSLKYKRFMDEPKCIRCNRTELIDFLEAQLPDCSAAWPRQVIAPALAVLKRKRHMEVR